ncbi:60Kd inner membrane protein-domain-containing protein [Rhexocercosporidium sp. MPI-PUGE-AT-0058]|nr:60Kd inner membrane protein-domain-containing protein [Rhexocercosporidium sp. MPI-PUGE-AT-0058]
MLLLRHPLLRPSTPSNLSRLLLLPPSCRSRAFHATPNRQSIIVSTITASHDALTSLHTITSLPWAYTIPLFAILIRTTIILPTAIYARRSTIKQISLFPLLEGWKHVLRKESFREVGHLGPVVAQSTFLKKLRAKRGEIYKRNGCGTWKNFLSLAQIPVFLSVMEALRKMCGSNQGVLGMLIGGNDITETGVGNTAAVLTGDGLVDSAINIPLETSLATEGALWFPNLLVADPHLILPFVLSGTILLNILAGRTPYSAMGVWRQRFIRSMGVAALCVGPLLLNVPSALLIYWISSSGTAYLQAVLLDRFMPLPKPAAPTKPKGQWRVGLGEPKPEGYVNPLLSLNESALVKPAQMKQATSRLRPVLEQNTPVGKGPQREGKH